MFGFLEVRFDGRKEKRMLSRGRTNRDCVMRLSIIPRGECSDGTYQLYDAAFIYYIILKTCFLLWFNSVLSIL